MNINYDFDKINKFTTSKYKIIMGKRTMMAKYEKELLDKLIELYHAKNNLKIHIANKRVKEIYDIIQNIAITKKIDENIIVALNKLMDLKSMLEDENYWEEQYNKYTQLQ